MQGRFIVPVLAGTGSVLSIVSTMLTIDAGGWRLGLALGLGLVAATIAVVLGVWLAIGGAVRRVSVELRRKSRMVGHANDRDQSLRD